MNAGTAARELGRSVGEQWADLERGWQAVLLGHVIAAAVVLF